jgi:hypothetical protein
MKSIAALLLAFALPACALFESAETPAQKVYAARVSYGVALDVALQYESLPRCGDGAPVICSDAGIVAHLRDGQKIADTALDAAEATVLTPGFGDDVYQSIAVAAVSAAAAFTSITNDLK